jgi:AcrR family transcriptional regulator
MTGTHRRLTGHIQVDLPPHEAFRLFTPRGEQNWMIGWQPRFPAPAADDTEPGTVFETDAHGQRTIWLVLEREWDKAISYARVTPDDNAGTVTIVINSAGNHSEVEVTYELTALTGATGRTVREFADAYPTYLRSWQDAIAAWLQTATCPTTLTTNDPHAGWGLVQATRQLILDTAARLFVERGFDGVTVTEIARAAELWEMTVFNYFPTKEDLVFGRMEFFEEQLLAAVEQRAPQESALAAFGRTVLAGAHQLSTRTDMIAKAAMLIPASPALQARERGNHNALHNPASRHIHRRNRISRRRHRRAQPIRDGGP